MTPDIEEFLLQFQSESNSKKSRKNNPCKE